MNHQCHCSKDRPISFHYTKIACTSTDNSLLEEMLEDQLEEMLEDQTIINENITMIISVNHQCQCVKDRPISFH